MNHRDTWTRGDPKKSFYAKGNYSMVIGTGGFKYTFINLRGCCRIGAGYIENGESTKV